MPYFVILTDVAIFIHALLLAIKSFNGLLKRTAYIIFINKSFPTET